MVEVVFYKFWCWLLGNSYLRILVVVWEGLLPCKASGYGTICLANSVWSSLLYDWPLIGQFRSYVVSTCRAS